MLEKTHHSFVNTVCFKLLEVFSGARQGLSLCKLKEIDSVTSFSFHCMLNKNATGIFKNLPT